MYTVPHLIKQHINVTHIRCFTITQRHANLTETHQLTLSANFNV